jgi:hypothetical protein
MVANFDLRSSERQDSIADEMTRLTQVSEVDGINRTTEGRSPQSRRKVGVPRKFWLASACAAPILLVSLFVALRTPPKQPDPESAAREELARLVASDQATAETFVGFFLPQLSAKHERPTGEGGELPPTGILEDHNERRQAYNAFLVLGNRFGLNREFDYMTFAPQPFDTQAEANSWCASNGMIVPTECFGKQLKDS